MIILWRVVEGQGEMGPQASTVRPVGRSVGKHHIAGP